MVVGCCYTGHPSLPLLLGLGGHFTLRSNWEIYCQEMVLAVRSVLDAQAVPGLVAQISDSNSINVDNPITHFERKFVLSEQKLFEVIGNFGENDRQARKALLFKRDVD